MAKKIDLEKLSEQIQKKHGGQVLIDLSTFVSTRQKCRFIDKDYGEFWALISNVRSGRGHPNRSSHNMSRAKTCSLHKIQEKIDALHDYGLKIVPETYTNTRTKCLFIDKDYGEFVSTPNRILRGGKHPKRSRIEMQVPIDKIKDRIYKKHKGLIEIVDGTYTGLKGHAEFIDKEFGRFTSTPEAVLNSYKLHPMRKKIRVRQRGLNSRLTEESVAAIAKKKGLELKPGTFKKTHEYAKFIHPIHGEWEALPYNIIYGDTTKPKNATNDPACEQEIFDFISKELGLKAIRNSKVLKSGRYPLEVDIYISKIKNLE